MYSRNYQLENTNHTSTQHLLCKTVPTNDPINNSSCCSTVVDVVAAVAQRLKKRTVQELSFLLMHWCLAHTAYASHIASLSFLNLPSATCTFPQLP